LRGGSGRGGGWDWLAAEGGRAVVVVVVFAVRMGLLAVGMSMVDQSIPSSKGSGAGIAGAASVVGTGRSGERRSAD